MNHSPSSRNKSSFSALRIAGLFFGFAAFVVTAAFLYSATAQSESSASSGAASSVLSSAAEAPEKTVPEVDVTKEFQIQDLSGLSGNILFSSNIADFDRIFVLDLDGKRIRRVVEGPGNNSYPTWSPDGREFAFVSDREGLKKIYVARWDGTNQRRLTVTPEKSPALAEDNPHWAPTGDRIAFYADSGKDGADANIMYVNSRGGVAEPLTRLSGRQTVPKFSPDGKSVAYSTNRFWPGWDVCAMGLKEKREKCVLTGTQTYCRQDYSPDGRKLAYSFGIFDDVNIGTFELEGGKEESLTAMPGREYDVVWAPDGASIAFTAEDGRKDVFNLYALPLSEKKPRALVASQHSIRFLSWTSAKTIDLEAERIHEEENG